MDLTFYYWHRANQLIAERSQQLPLRSPASHYLNERYLDKHVSEIANIVMAHYTDTENEATLREFRAAVNMSAKELESWLKTEDSKSVGMKEQKGDESTGHQSGRHIVELLQQKNSNYGQDDYNQMRRVVSYVHRHLAQKPSGDVEHSRWRYSLKNWGHDPLKH